MAIATGIMVLAVDGPGVCLHGRLLFALLGYALRGQNGRTEVVTLILAASRSILCGRGPLVDHVHCHDSQIRAIIF